MRDRTKWWLPVAFGGLLSASCQRLLSCRKMQRDPKFDGHMELVPNRYLILEGLMSRTSNHFGAVCITARDV